MRRDPPDDPPGPSPNPSLSSRFVLALVLVLLLAALPAGIALVRLDGAADSLRGADPVSARYAGRGVRDGIVFGTLAVAATIWAGVALNRRTKRAFHRLGTVFRQVAEGNLNVSATDTGLREVDELSRDAADAFDRLREFDRLKTRRIREERRVMDAVFATHPDGLALVNAERHIAIANARFRTLVSKGDEDVGGAPVEEILGPSVLEAVRRVQARRDPVSLEWRGPARDGAPPLRVHASAVSDEVDTAPRVLLRMTAAVDMPEPAPRSTDKE